jgi:hypothetical protein
MYFLNGSESKTFVIAETEICQLSINLPGNSVLELANIFYASFMEGH